MCIDISLLAVQEVFLYLLISTERLKGEKVISPNIKKY